MRSWNDVDRQPVLKQSMRQCLETQGKAAEDYVVVHRHTHVHTDDPSIHPDIKYVHPSFGETQLSNLSNLSYSGEHRACIQRPPSFHKESYHFPYSDQISETTNSFERYMFKAVCTTYIRDCSRKRSSASRKFSCICKMQAPRNVPHTACTRPGHGHGHGHGHSISMSVDAGIHTSIDIPCLFCWVYVQAYLRTDELIHHDSLNNIKNP